MACYAYSVLTQWFSSVCSGAGSETPLSKESKQVVKASKQVVIASSMTPIEVNDVSSRPEPPTIFLKVAKCLTGKEGIPPR